MASCCTAALNSNSAADRSSFGVRAVAPSISARAPTSIPATTEASHPHDPPNEAARCRFPPRPPAARLRFPPPPSAALPWQSRTRTMAVQEPAAMRVDPTETTHPGSFKAGWRTTQRSGIDQCGWWSTRRPGLTWSGAGYRRPGRGPRSGAGRLRCVGKRGP